MLPPKGISLKNAYAFTIWSYPDTFAFIWKYAAKKSLLLGHLNIGNSFDTFTFLMNHWIWEILLALQVINFFQNDAYQITYRDLVTLYNNCIIFYSAWNNWN